MAGTDNLTLQINKVVTSVDNDRVEYNASERGKVLEVQIVGTNHVALDLTGKTLRFVENKTGGKIVVDDQADKGNEKDGAGIFTILDAKSGRFTYQYSRYIYQASGEAWFEVYSDSDHIDTTQKFYIDIENGTLLDVQNDNYISSLQAEIASYKATNQRLNEESDAQLNALKAKIQQSENMTDKAKSDAIAAINEAKNTATTTLNNLNGQYSSYASKYEALESKINSDIKSINDRADSQINSIKADWDKEKQAAESDRATIRQNGADEINSIKSDWSKQTDAINADAKTKIDAAIAAVETARDNAIKQAVSDFSNQRNNLQADYNSWKQDTVNDFNSQLATLQGKIDAETKQQSDLKAAIDSARAAVNKIADVDFTKFAHKDDVDQALKSIDFGKIGIKENYLNPSTNVAQRTIFPVKQSDGNWIFDRASDDATAETAKKALEQVLQNGKTLNQLSEQFNTKADKDDVDEALKNSNSNEGKINQLNTKFDKYAGNQVAKNADANDLTTSGTYFIDTTGNNFPINHWGVLVVHQANEDGNIRLEQIFYPDDNSSPWFRMRITDNWAPWHQVASKEDLNDLQNQINDRATNSTVNVAAPLFRKISNANTWQDILGVANSNNVLVSIRDEAGGNTLGNFSSAVVFGGGDTKGVLNVAYADHTARIIGGNSDRPQWHEDIAWKSDINNLDNKFNGYDSRIGNLERKIDGLTPFTIITQAQYDKLTEAQKQSGTYGISG